MALFFFRSISRGVSPTDLSIPVPRVLTPQVSESSPTSEEPSLRTPKVAELHHIAGEILLNHSSFDEHLSTEDIRIILDRILNEPPTEDVSPNADNPDCNIV